MLTSIICVNPKNFDIKQIQIAARALKEGNLVVFPTETVYGIGANAENKGAMSRLRKLKQRPKGPFTYHIASKNDLKKLGCIVDKAAKRLTDKFWPGPLTLIFKTKKGGNIGVRMPAHKVALALLKGAGAPVVAPSANLKGKMPAVSAKDALKGLNGLVDIIIDSGKTKVGISSTVVDLTGRTAKILRQGSINPLSPPKAGRGLG